MQLSEHAITAWFKGAFRFRRQQQQQEPPACGAWIKRRRGNLVDFKLVGQAAKSLPVLAQLLADHTSKVKRLDLCGCSLRILPLELQAFTALEQLHLGGNRL